jgi:HAD superfamily phosphatase (TIGR01668 family)
MWLARVGQWLKPDLRVDSLPEVPLERLRQQGIRALIVDLDNTITCWQSSAVGEEARAWFRKVQNQGFAVCLSSNNGYARGAPVASLLGVPLVPNAVKPRRMAFRQAMEILGSSPDETAVIGDQIFTDVLGGRRLGLFTVLVCPLSPREFITTRLLRRLERLVMRSWEQD